MGFRFQNSLQSKIDQTSKISKSVFISNFPDDCSSRDLWKVCNGYGTVVDVFIPNKRSKAGKRFAFVRFINVLNLDRLIENLKTIWIGRFHLSANTARFERPKASTFQKEKPVPSGNVTGFKQSIVQNQGGPKESYSSILKPSLVLDDSCLVNRDLTNCVMGEVLQFSSINNLQVLLSNEGFHNTRVVYLGGLWVMIELKSSKSKSKFMEHVGVASWFRRLCNAQSDFAAKERIVWVDIEGVPLNAWTRSTFQKISSKWGELVYSLRGGFKDFKEKMEVQQEEQAQELYKRSLYILWSSLDGTRVGCLSVGGWMILSYSERDSSWPEGRLALNHGRISTVRLSLNALKSSEDHGECRSLSTVDAYNPEAMRASYVDAVNALEDASFPLVNLLKSKKSQEDAAALPPTNVWISFRPLSSRLGVGEAVFPWPHLFVEDYIEEDTDET
ncbi:RNA-directed DNA polymerase, eukaryota, nucleotide-binding alpha-beta plait domain protein [Tanacetum coccineum]